MTWQNHAIKKFPDFYLGLVNFKNNPCEISSFSLLFQNFRICPCLLSFAWVLWTLRVVSYKYRCKIWLSKRWSSSIAIIQNIFHKNFIIFHHGSSSYYGSKLQKSQFLREPVFTPGIFMYFHISSNSRYYNNGLRSTISNICIPGLHIWAGKGRISPKLPHLQSKNSS